MRPEALVDEGQVQVDLVQLAATRVQVFGAALDGFVDEALGARRRFDEADAPLTEVLIDATRVIEESKGRLESMDDVAALNLIETLIVAARDAIDEPDMSRLRQKRVLVDEAPDRQQAIDAAGVLIVAEDARHTHHARTSTLNRACFAAS